MKVGTETILRATLRADGEVSPTQIVEGLAILKGQQLVKVSAAVLLLSQAEAARVLNCSRFTIRRLEQQGTLKAVYLTPRLKRYRFADVQALAAAGTTYE